MSEVEAGPVASPHELDQILVLQRANLARNLDAEARASQGFVTVEHSRDVLAAMHAVAPSVVARAGGALVGYALVMPVECRALVPVLEPMFARAFACRVARFYVMGQICVAEPWRGRGVFDLLYAAHRRQLAARYDRVVTEVSTRNARSLRANERVGFRIIERYRDASDEWALLVWDWATLG